MPFFKRNLLISLFFVAISLCFATFGYSQNKSLVKLKSVVIDAGHGGKDPGCVSGKYLEKDITLSVALKLGEMIKKNYPDIKVIYTRSTDKYVTLNNRSKIANSSQADLFISIHINASRSTSPRGVETFVMGLDKENANMEVCQLENSVITLEEDYSSSYSGFDPNNPESYIIFSLLQNSHLEQSLIFAENVQKELAKGPITHNRGVKQAPYLVLWKCTMPSVLIELGFISNSSDRKILTNKNNHTTMATALFKAFKAYKSQYETELYIDTSNDTIYTIQVMALSKALPEGSKEFKGLDCNMIQSGTLYKYTYGSFSSEEQARKELQEVRSLFPKAYIIQKK